MKSGNLFSFDPILFIAMLALVIIGILFIYSSGITSSGELVSSEFIFQIIWAVSGLLIYFALLLVDYTKLKLWVFPVYASLTGLLVLTLLFGREVNGSRSWLGMFGFGIQPSEFMKIGTIFFIATFLEKNKKTIDTLWIFIKGLIIAIIPTILVLLQPDLGTASVYLPIYLVMVFSGGAKKRYVFFILATVFLTLLFGVLPVGQFYFLKDNIAFIQVFTNEFLYYFTLIILITIGIISILAFIFSKKEYFYWIAFVFIILTISFLLSRIVSSVLKDYQIMRLIVFIDPGIDPQGNGWNIIQSITAVGSGGFAGKGFLQGTQSHYRFLPQQSTDFIFSIIAEELGFLGSFFLLLAFSTIIIRGLSISINAKDSFGAYTITGIVAMYFVHMVVNIGMAIGVMPITGIPLFFLSYGGSSLWTGMIGMALIQNIYIRRYRY